MQRFTPCLWFDDRAEEAANFYVSIFKNAKLGTVSRYGDSGSAAANRPKGSVMTVTFELDGMPFMGLNGGPIFKFSEAISFMVNCKDQDEIDYYWAKLTAGGGEEGPCGWLKDKFGLSWQIVPTMMEEMMKDKDPAKAERVMAALLRMKKLNIQELKNAFEGKTAEYAHTGR